MSSRRRVSAQAKFKKLSNELVRLSEVNEMLKTLSEMSEIVTKNESRFSFYDQESFQAFLCGHLVSALTRAVKGAAKLPDHILFLMHLFRSLIDYHEVDDLFFINLNTDCLHRSFLDGLPDLMAICPEYDGIHRVGYLDVEKPLRYYEDFTSASEAGEFNSNLDALCAYLDNNPDLIDNFNAFYKIKTGLREDVCEQLFYLAKAGGEPSEGDLLRHRLIKHLSSGSDMLQGFLTGGSNAGGTTAFKTRASALKRFSDLRVKLFTALTIKAIKNSLFEIAELFSNNEHCFYLEDQDFFHALLGDHLIRAFLQLAEEQAAFPNHLYFLMHVYRSMLPYLIGEKDGYFFSHTGIGTLIWSFEDEVTELEDKSLAYVGLNRAICLDSADARDDFENLAGATEAEEFTSSLSGLLGYLERNADDTDAFEVLFALKCGIRENLCEHLFYRAKASEAPSDGDYLRLELLNHLNSAKNLIGNALTGKTAQQQDQQ